MPSRVEKYNKTMTKSRTDKNKDLYENIYDEVKYSNVEGISVIQKDENIDINKIYELINGKKENKEIKTKKEYPVFTEEDKNYDVLDAITKAKKERTSDDKKTFNTEYNILKDLNLNEGKVPEKLEDEELKNMIEAVSKNSKNDYTIDLLDDLKTVHDSSLKNELNKLDLEDELDNLVEEKVTKAIENLPISEIDKSFYTSSLSFTEDDFEQIKENIDKNNKLTKILLFIFCVIILTAILVGVYLLVK